MPSPRGVSAIGVTAAPAAMAPSIPMPPVGGGLSEMEVSVDTPSSSSDDWWQLGNALLLGESGAKPRALLLPTNPHQTGELLGTSSSQDDCGATRG